MTEAPDNTPRLVRLRDRVRAALETGAAYTLRELEAECAPCTQTSVSARLRELRRLDGLDVRKTRVGTGLYAYYLRPAPPVGPCGDRTGAVSSPAPPVSESGTTTPVQMDLAEMLE